MASNSKRKADYDADRLNALQMADLGTARREYVSTADDSRKRIHAGLDDIERHRQSNIAGTIEQKRAQANRPLLNAWANFHKTVTDTGKLEQLDDIMNGQSHRAQLTASLHGNEPVRQAAGGHARSFSHAPSNHPYPKQSTGRGGGIIGTRTRAQGSPIRISTHLGVHHQAANYPTRQDPALDINNPGSTPPRGRGAHRGQAFNVNRPGSPLSRGRGAHRGQAFNVNSSGSPPSRGRGASRGHGKMGSPARSHAAHKARRLETRPKRPEPSGDYAKQLTSPADFMNSIRASFGTPPSSQPPMAVSTPKTAPTPKAVSTSKAVTAPKPAILPQPAMAPKPVAAPNTVKAPRLVAAQQPVISPQPVMAPQVATTSKLFGGSSLNDSVFAAPASSTPAATTEEQVPDSPSPPPRIVPFDKTAAFSSRAKIARSEPSVERKPADEQQEKEPIEQKQSPVLLDIDQGVEESAEAQVRNFLFSPSMADLTGITFPKEDEVQALGLASANLKNESARSRSDLQAYIVKEMLLQILGEFSGYLQKYAKKTAQPASLEPIIPVDDALAATSQDQIEAIAKKLVEDWLKDHQTASEAPGGTTRKEHAVQPALGQHPDQVQPLSMAATASPTLQPSQDPQSGLPNVLPRSPKPEPKQIRDNPMPKTGAKAPELESNQLSKVGRFDTYRTPPRSISGTVTDSSDEKKQRITDVSLLSPQKASCPADFPTEQFKSLRVSGTETTQSPPKEPPDVRLTQPKGGIPGASSKPPILGSMECSKFAVPVKSFYQINNTKAGTTSEERTTLSVSMAPQDAPASRKIIRNEASSSAVSQEQRSTLAQSTSNMPKETSIKEPPPAAGPKAAQEPDDKKSRVFSGGMGESIWATADSGPSKFASFLKPRQESTSLRHSSAPSTKAEGTTSSGVRFVGPAPYIPRQK